MLGAVLLAGDGEKDLTTITIASQSGDDTGTVVATDGHPFWVPDLGRWVDAGDLLPGDWLATSAGTRVQVTAIQHDHRDQTVHNLTVADTHTYYVTTGNGTDAVLVHNCGTASSITSPIWSGTKSMSPAQNALRHFGDHGSEFPHLNNSLEYVAEAQGFLKNPSVSILTRTRANGDVVRYDPATEGFGVMNSTGAPRTYFVPDPAVHGYPSNLDYFNAQ